MLRDHAEGLTIASGADTVEDTVCDWLAYGLAGRATSAAANYATIAEVRIIPCSAAGAAAGAGGGVSLFTIRSPATSFAVRGLSQQRRGTP